MTDVLPDRVFEDSDNEKKRLVPENISKKALKDMPTVSEFKKQNRDPSNVNEDVQIHFEDIIAEPDSFHSSTYVWKTSTFIFKFGKDAAYQFFSFFLGVPLSFFWGCFFALTACMHVWCYAPLKRSQSIKMGCWSQFLSKLLSVIFDPFFSSVGKTFSQVKVEHNVNTVEIKIPPKNQD